MSTNITNIMKRILSGVMAIGMAISLIPSVTYAAQSNEYVDPADVWIESNGRTNELDINATTTYETIYCPVCDIETTQLIYRVPEYTKSGETALNRGVVFSDGNTGDGKGTGNLDSGTPGVNAYYSGSHWTKSVCQKCGTINSVDGLGSYACGKNVYILNPCDNNFFLDFDNTTYTPYDSRYHTTVLKKGEYCQFCKGTYARATEKKETHNFDETVDGELGNQRFHITGNCEECGYIKNEYIAAKSVIQSHYGKVDGNAHTILVSDLSESGVNTSIRYGTEAGRCNKTSAPNYTDEGYYPIYYEITYSYSGESMTETGVSYVWLIEDNSNSNINTAETPHVHDYRYFETVLPTCTELGYDRFQCSGCGALQKTNYVPATGHNYDNIIIREASCQQGGIELHMCKDCGSHYTESTSITNHKYQTSIVPATCTMNGYTEHKCIDCGYKYITNLTPLARHDYREKVTAPTCKVKGYTTYTCNNCGDTYISDYTEPTGHEWDEGHIITNSTCESEGVMEYDCKRCDERMIKATSSKGHTYGDDATCTEPQTCTVCGAVLNLPTGHHYLETVTIPTCTSMGYTTFTCEDCGVSYIGNYTDKAEHHYHGVVTYPTCTELGYTTYTCTECGDSYKSDYKDKKLHSYKAVVTPPTCTAMGFTTYTCENCGDSYVADYTDVLQHNYTKQVIEPTCTELGYTIYKCPDCGKEYIGDEKESIKHHYNSVITEPTCEEMGFTTYTCEDCGYSYAADYTDAKGHDYKEKITAPTCTEIGFSTFTCKDCGTSYIGNEKAKLPHNYDKAVTDPTCTEMGYTVFNCKDCGDTYTGDYVDANGHIYKETVTEPTCTEIGFSTFTCEVCGNSYIGNETAKTAHNYEKNVTVPTCLDLGFTTYTCIDCGESHNSDYTEALGHQPTEWIIDVPATIENAGSKHIECERCGEILQTAEIAQLIDKDNSDEDGNAQVGNFSIILTDKDGKPVFDSEISIDVNDNVTIKLPEGRLLDFADRTTITAFFTDTQEPADDLRVFIYDTNNNAATGTTNENGQLVVPNNQSNTGDDNGTIGNEDGDKKNTFVVTVTDKTNVIIPNCDIHIGESNNIVVDLPDGIKPTRENPVIVTVTDHNGEAKKDITVIAIGDADFMEKGSTDMYGTITLPTASDGYTDESGKVNVDNINVIVNDEIGVIPNAYVIHNEDGTINVTLPDEKTISYANRITVTVLDSIGKPVAEVNVTVNDIAEKSYTANTDENGTIIVPPLFEDMTDSEGKAVVNGYNVLITDETKPIENAFITIGEGQINVMLPEGVLIDITNRITAIITDGKDKPIKDMTVIFTDKAENTESNVTDENGKATVPPTNVDITDFNGYSEVNGFIVTVKNELGAVEKAQITYNAEIKNEDGTVNTAENISVILPENIKFDYANRVTITVAKKADNTAVKDMMVVVSEIPAEDYEAKSLSGVTNNDGKAIFPPLSEDITDDNGSSDITEDKPGKGEDTDGDGVEDKPGEIEAVTYKVSVNDTKGIINNAFVEIKDGKIYVTLPDTHTLTTSNQTTVTVLDKDGNAVKGVSVTIKDKTTEKTASTDANGKVTLPVKTSSGGGSSSGGSSGGGGGYISSYSTVNVKVTDKDGKTVSVTKSVDNKGNVTVTLPTGKVIDSENYYTITVTDSKGAAKADTMVTLKDRKNGTATGTTDKNGMLTLPAKEHKAYIVGYDDGTFKPDSDMSRAEAAAIFARLIAEAKGESISRKASFKDVDKNEWYAVYVGYLEKYNVINGYTDGTFKPDASVTRAEFVAMTVRYYELFNDVNKTGNTVKYTDVENSYWAYSDIAFAKNIGWLNGYSDGSFRGDNYITRAEVVTIVNRATGRVADKEYVKDNFTKLNRFTDVTDSSMWYFFDVAESCNDHKAVTSASSEVWVK